MALPELEEANVLISTIWSRFLTYARNRRPLFSEPEPQVKHHFLSEGWTSRFTCGNSLLFINETATIMHVRSKNDYPCVYLYVYLSTSLVKKMSFQNLNFLQIISLTRLFFGMKGIFFRKKELLISAIHEIC